MEINNSNKDLVEIERAIKDTIIKCTIEKQKCILSKYNGTFNCDYIDTVCFQEIIKLTEIQKKIKVKN